MVGEDELPDVVEQARGVGELLLALRQPGGAGDLAGVARDGGTVAGGHPIAGIERVQQRADHAELEAGELVGPRFELAGTDAQLALALLGEEQLAEKVLEAREHDDQKGDGRHPDLHVEDGDDDGEQRAEQLGGQERHESRVGLLGERRSLQPALVAGGKNEVQSEGEDEGREDEDVEGSVRPGDAGGLDGRVEGQAGEQGEPGVDDEVLAQVVGRLAVAQPANQDRDRADRRGRRAAEQNDRQDEGEEAARDLQLGRARGGGGEVAGDGAARERGKEGEVPGGGCRRRRMRPRRRRPGR